MKTVCISALLIFLASCNDVSQNTLKTESNTTVKIQEQQVAVEIDEEGEGKINGVEEMYSQSIAESEDSFAANEETTIKEVTENMIEYDELSLPTIMEEDIIGTDFQLEEVLSTTTNYTRYRISYKYKGISLSGIMNIPNGTGPYPLLVLNHGYIDTRYYTNGRGLKREQDYFANNGYVVIHPDYRNHAFSDKVSETPYDFRLGYTRDVIASIIALKNSRLEELSVIDLDNIGMLGHSMGSGIAQNIAVSKPSLIKAVVLYGPVSNNEYENFEKFQLSNPNRSTRVAQVLETHKSAEENPGFWGGVSSSNFIENIEVPFKIFTGTADADTPTQWAQNIAQDLRDAEKSVDIVSYPGEGHEFGPKFSDFMTQSDAFLEQYLK